jgi:type I restriction enzyme R subunit
MCHAGVREFGQFIESVSITGDTRDQWQQFLAARRAAELEEIITTEGLRPEEARAFVDDAFRDGAVPTTGTAITRILPPVSRFAPDASHATKKRTVLDRLIAFVDRYAGLS